MAEKCPNAVRVADPFHVVSWATEALNEVRCQSWNEARKLARAEPSRPRGQAPPRRPPGRRPGGPRESKAPDTRCGRTRKTSPSTKGEKLAWIVKADPRLYRAYLHKEGRRAIFTMPIDAARDALDGWVSWARRSRIPAFVKLQRSIVKHRERILAAIAHGLSNTLIESTNTKIRLITRVAFGFKSAEPLIALTMLTLGAHRPELPDR